MAFSFNFDSIDITEFGIGSDNGDGRAFSLVAVDEEVQEALLEMVEATRDQLKKIGSTPAQYEPSDKYASLEHLVVPLDDDLAESLKTLHQTNNYPFDGTALNTPGGVFCYFTRLQDTSGRRLTGVRRASQFKSVLSKKLLSWFDDSIGIVEGNIFKLDMDFDLLIDESNIHILRPSGFEFVGQLKEAILAAVPKNIEEMRNEIDFIEFDSIQEYAITHPRAARYLASIRSLGEAKNISRDRLRDACAQLGVEIEEEDGKIKVDNKNIMGFLEILDRRRYELELVEGEPEQFRAASRSKLTS